MQVQHKQAILVLRKLAIASVFIGANAMCTHATTLIPKIESQTSLNTKNFCKSDSDYYGIPREEIQRIYTFQGTNNRSYDLIYAYGNNKKNPGTNYVDGIYFAPKTWDENKDIAFRVDGISIIKEADGSQTLGFDVVGYAECIDRNAQVKGLMQESGIFVPPKKIAEEVLYLIANSKNNSTGYNYLDGGPLIKGMKSIERTNENLSILLIEE